MTPEQVQKIADIIQLLLKAKRYNEVEKLIAQCEKETSHFAELFAWKANLQLCVGNHMAASHWIQHGLKLDSSNLNLNLYCATLAQQNGNYSRAIDHFQKSLRLTTDEHILADIQNKLNKLWRLIETDFAPTFSPRIIIGSPVCQKTAILKEFLLSLTELHKESLDVAYCFIDDNKDAESAKLLLDQIHVLRKELTNPLCINDIHIQISISVGISSCPHDAHSAEELFRIADQRMYLDKQTKTREMSTRTCAETSAT